MFSQYYYCPHGSLTAIYRWDNNNKNSSTFIKDCIEKEEARKEVYLLNGWNYKAPVLGKK